MIREIKFRAWDAKKKVMTESFTLQHLIQCYDSEYNGDQREELTNYNYYFRDEWPVFMQYTGLKDKNGKEIYEGDIISWSHGAGDGGTSEVVYSVEATAFEEWEIGKSSGYALGSITCEIIGDIYSNPDLIK